MTSDWDMTFQSSNIDILAYIKTTHFYDVVRIRMLRQFGATCNTIIHRPDGCAMTAPKGPQQVSPGQAQRRPGYTGHRRIVSSERAAQFRCQRALTTMLRPFRANDGSGTHQPRAALRGCAATALPWADMFRALRAASHGLPGGRNCHPILAQILNGVGARHGFSRAKRDDSIPDISFIE